MKTCPDCKTSVSSNAQECPGCGRRFTTALTKAMLWMIVAVAVFLVIVALVVPE